ncbi:MAG: gliding motility-associated C-terminal domain-containing protein [Chitinophagaceae bacterium]|nr:gliding motility-associated C-terminal domain-containing protein [Chitinophagaceae bacterium]
MKKLFILFLLYTSLGTFVYGRHIRAGEIFFKQITGLRYEITVIGYTRGHASFGSGALYLGDGTMLHREDAISIEQESIPTWNMQKTTLIFEHTYPTYRTYIVGYSEDNRANVINAYHDNANTFYIEAKIQINREYETKKRRNNSPIFTLFPFNRGYVGISFFHNPGIFDADGDSLSCMLIPSQSAFEKPVSQYQFPDNKDFYTDYNKGNEQKDAPPFCKINPTNGIIQWDAPGDKTDIMFGERVYLLTIRLLEWTKIDNTWKNTGYVTRDMLIYIDTSDNKRPFLKIPSDTCVIVPNSIQKVITATNSQSPILKVFHNLPAYSSAPFWNINNEKISFSWKTTCPYIRFNPYTFIFEAWDTTYSILTDIKAWNIQIVSPIPQNLKATLSPPRSVKLSWDPYLCPQAKTLQIWRRKGSFPYTPKNCETGIPKAGEYELLQTVPATDTIFWDKKKLAPIVTYCYRIVAVFSESPTVFSPPSTEICITMPANAPIITNVDIVKTDSLRGKISVQWIQPFEVDSNQLPTPYSYKVIRKSTKDASFYETSADTLLNDTLLNTNKEIYQYQVLLLDKYKKIRDSSAIASSVFLQIKPNLNVSSFTLEWNADVPWILKNQKYPHSVFRNQVLSKYPDSLVKISEVDVSKNGFIYIDSGKTHTIPLDPSTQYCYYVQTMGAYQNKNIHEPLINKSQIACSFLKDNTSPCTPSAFHFSKNNIPCEERIEQDCQIQNISNILVWKNNSQSNCQSNDIHDYSLYWAEDDTQPFKSIASIKFAKEQTEQSFTHSSSSLKGCYKISATDISGNESPLSESICQDNCPYIYFPNIFTPNNDGKNDVFTPYYFSGQSLDEFEKTKCVRFVTSIEFRVFHKVGICLYHYNSENSENGILIKWKGIEQGGTDLESGTYFFESIVKFNTLNPLLSTRIYKGWVTIMR